MSIADACDMLKIFMRPGVHGSITFHTNGGGSISTVDVKQIYTEKPKVPAAA